VYRSANQMSVITTMNIPTLTHTLSLQSDMTCPTHRGRLGAARCQIVVRRHGLSRVTLLLWGAGRKVCSPTPLRD
jgi:hypothetical protein